MKNKSTIIIKADAEVLRSPHQRGEICEGIRKIHSEVTQRVVFVSSGAAEYGKHITPNIQDIPTLSAIGWAHQMREFIDRFSIILGPIVTTREDLNNPETHIGIIRQFNTMFSHGILPVVNDNHSLSTESVIGLRLGNENDAIALDVAQGLRASKLIYITKQGGVFPDNLSIKKPLQRIAQSQLTDDFILNIDDRSSLFGVGGTASKLCAARIAGQSSGMQVALCGAENIYAAARGQTGENYTTIGL